VREQRLAEAGHVSVAEDPEAASEEALPYAVALDVLRGKEADERLRRRHPDSAHAMTLRSADAVAKLVVHTHPAEPDGCVLRLTPESAGWTYVGFAVYRGGRVTERFDDRETCIVLLSGHADLRAGGREWPGVGGRASVFDGPPTALYVPPGIEWSAQGDDFAVCTAPASTGAELRLLEPGGARFEARGADAESRSIFHILMEDQAAESLLVTEVRTPPAHWSSYPPHKHDVDDPPRETLLEETYYHRLRPAAGFAFQRVYTDDRALDESIAVGDGDVVLVPRGYHPFAAGARNESYYLNVMAGPVREWRITADPAFSP
jgi:5-deoxy-glucuronate isomerase